MSNRTIRKTVMAAVCTLMLAVALPASAQTQMPGAQIQPQGEVSALSLDEGIFGKDIKTQDGAIFGRIDDVIFGNRGQISHYLASVGAGASEKAVALNPDQIQFSGQEYALFNGTRAELENMPGVNPYDYGVYGYYGSYASPYGEEPSYGPGAYSRPYFDPYRDRSMSESYEQGPSGPCQERQEQGGSWQSRQSYLQQYPRRGYPYGGSMGQRSGARQERMQEYMSRGISGDVFLSAEVFNPRHEMIGEVDDLVVDPQNGRITHAVIGMSDKQVLVPFGRLRYVGPRSVMYRGTEAQLERMPEYQVGEGGRVTGASMSQTEQKAGSTSPQGGQFQTQGKQGQ